jgi:hypothetical protein
MSEAGTAYASQQGNDPEELVTHRAATTIFALVALALAPGAASGQFTTFVSPPRKAAEDSAKASIVAAQSVRDSAARMTLSDMKAWVDSAAGVSSNTQVVAEDSAGVAARQPTAPGVRPSQPGATTFSDGALAPNTASPLPAILMGGLLLLVVGGTLLLRPREP